MRRIFKRIARKFAPGVVKKLEAVEVIAVEDGTAAAAVNRALMERIRDLEVQLKEVRQDQRRVTELYDLMFERLRADNPLRVGGDDSADSATSAR